MPHTYRTDDYVKRPAQAGMPEFLDNDIELSQNLQSRNLSAETGPTASTGVMAVAVLPGENITEKVDTYLLAYAILGFFAGMCSGPLAYLLALCSCTKILGLRRIWFSIGVVLGLGTTIITLAIVWVKAIRE